MINGNLFEDYTASPSTTKSRRRNTRLPASQAAETQSANTTHVANTPSAIQPPKASIPFIATDLTLSFRPEIDSDDDCLLDGKAFRRLNPDYYAWLRKQMEMAQIRYQRGVLPDAQYQSVKDRFNAMHDLALSLFGEAALVEAMTRAVGHLYSPPTVRVSQAVAVLLQDVADNPVAQPDNSSHSDAPAKTPGPRVSDHAGHWSGHILREYPADEWFPHGWAEIQLDDGHIAQTDLRALVQADGTPMVSHPQYTADEQRAIALAREEKPEDFADLEATLPILAFPVPGTWRFEEQPDIDDFLKVNDIRERAQALGWTDVDLFQTCGHYRFPCGQDYGLVCFLRGRTIGEITAERIAIQPDKPGAVALTFSRPHRAPVPEEVPDGSIREAISECCTIAAEKAAG